MKLANKTLKFLRWTTSAEELSFAFLIGNLSGAFLAFVALVIAVVGISAVERVIWYFE